MQLLIMEAKTRSDMWHKSHTLGIAQSKPNQRYSTQNLGVGRVQDNLEFMGGQGTKNSESRGARCDGPPVIGCPVQLEFRIHGPGSKKFGIWAGGGVDISSDPSPPRFSDKLALWIV